MLFNRFSKITEVLCRCKATFRNYSTKKININENPETPIKYSMSPASKWQAKTSRTGIAEPRLWYEPYVIIASLTVFLIYFTVLREENDVDAELGRTLYSRIEGLEEHQLKASLAYNQSHGLDTSKILERLTELEKENKSGKN